RLAGGEVDFGRSADDELDAAAADIDAQGSAAVEVDRRADRAKNVVRFFFSRDHANADADIVLDPAEKLAAVGRLTHRAGRDADDLVDLPAARDLHHLL